MARWYKRYGSDFIAATMALTLEQKGAYSLCLDLIYDRGGPIPDDARWLAGVCGVSLRKWASIRAALIAAGKLTARDEKLMNDRAERMIAAADEASREHAENGAKGGRKRAENLSKTPQNEGENVAVGNENNHLGQARLNHTRSQNLEESSTKPVQSTAPPRELPLDRLCRVMRIDPAMLHRRAAFQRFPALFGDWQDQGCDPERDIWPIIERLAARNREITTPTYFAKAIKAARDERQVTERSPAQKWADRVAAFRIEADSWDSAWGPRPDQPGCLAPSEALRAA